MKIKIEKGFWKAFLFSFLLTILIFPIRICSSIDQFQFCTYPTFTEIVITQIRAYMIGAARVPYFYDNYFVLLRGVEIFLIALSSAPFTATFFTYLKKRKLPLLSGTGAIRNGFLFLLIWTIPTLIWEILFFLFDAQISYLWTEYILTPLIGYLGPSDYLSH